MRELMALRGADLHRQKVSKSVEIRRKRKNEANFTAGATSDERVAQTSEIRIDGHLEGVGKRANPDSQVVSSHWLRRCVAFRQPDV